MCANTRPFYIRRWPQIEVKAQDISLSGGQKWQLTLARVFYSRDGIMIMDDVFSALDAHVNKHIYENAVMGELSEGRTRILATYHVSLCLPKAKYAVRLSAKGVLEHAGLIEDLRQTGTLNEILKANDAVESVDVEEDEALSAVETNTLPTIPSGDAAFAAEAPPKKLHEVEKRETGRVKTSVYAGYLTQGFTLGLTYWVKIWANDYDKTKDIAVSLITYHYPNNLQTQFPEQPISHISPISPVNSTVVSTSTRFPINAHNKNLWFYPGVYCLISTISVLSSVGRLYMVYSSSIRASRKIFKDILRSVLRAPLRWLNVVPMGRILNRFTGDFTNLDLSLAQNFYYFAGAISDTLGVLVAAIFVSPFIIICAALLLLACTYFARSYIAAA
ncbi:hypothetical protein BDZ45DRAFT_742025 [Acephala macrosclerotiorum]|nr:hypothetical protein BDZ45DRAFT_742025 [Acephala macrosclerotiorum]